MRADRRACKCVRIEGDVSRRMAFLFCVGRVARTSSSAQLLRHLLFDYFSKDDFKPYLDAAFLQVLLELVCHFSSFRIDLIAISQCYLLVRVLKTVFRNVVQILLPNP